MLKRKENNNEAFTNYILKYGNTIQPNEIIRYMSAEELEIYNYLMFESKELTLKEEREQIKKYGKNTMAMKVNLGFIPLATYESELESAILESYRPFKFIEDDKSKSYIIVERSSKEIPFSTLKNEICMITYTKAGLLRRKLRQLST